MRKPRRRHRRVTFLVGIALWSAGLLLACIFGGRGDVWRYVNGRLGLAGVGVAAWYVGIVLMVRAVLTLVHELGHAVAAWSVGMEITEISADILTLRRTERGKLALCLVGAPGEPVARAEEKHADGFVAAAPRTASRLLARQAWMVAGGQVAELATGAACAALLCLAGARLPSAINSILEVTCALVALSFAQFLFRAGPHWSGMRPDLNQLIGLWRRDPEVVLPVLHEALYAAARARCRPRDWGTAAAPLLPLLQRSTPDPGLVMLVLWVALDRGEVDAARTLLACLHNRRESSDAGLRLELSIQAMAFHALLGGDVQAAKHEMTLALAEAPDERYCLLAGAALALACGDRQVAGERLQAWTCFAAQSAGVESADCGREWILERLHAELGS